MPSHCLRQVDIPLLPDIIHPSTTTVYFAAVTASHIYVITKPRPQQEISHIILAGHSTFDILSRLMQDHQVHQFGYNQFPVLIKITSA